MSKSNGKSEMVGSNPSIGTVVPSLKSVLTGCTALTFVVVVGMGAGSALADITIATGTTTQSSTITSGSGIVNLAGGTLNFSATSTLSNAIAAATGTTSTLTAGAFTGTLSGVLSGAGGIALNSGKLILTNATDSAYLGTVTVASGATLQLGNSGTGMIGGTVHDTSVLINNGNVTFSNTGTSNNYFGAMSGTGTVTLSGTSGSSVTFAGANTYTGITTIATGNTLNIGNGNDYGSIASSAITNNGTLNFNRVDTLVYNGNITGGVVLKAGAGTTILNGISTLSSTTTMQVGTGTNAGVNYGYYGSLRVSAGTLMIGDSSHKTAAVTVALTNMLQGTGLSGFGTLNGNVINGDDTQGTTSSRNTSTTQFVGGILTPGDGTIPGTFTINGNYTQNSFGGLLITATPTSVSRLTVSGTADVKGQLSVSGTTGSYAVGLYPILTAGTIVHKFDRVLVGTPDSANAFGVYYAPSGKEVDLVVAPKTMGQVYSDLVLQSFDTVTSMNDIVLDHTSTVCAKCSGFKVWGQSYLGTDRYSAGNNVAAFSNHTLGVIGGLDYQLASGISFHGVMASGNGDLGIHDQSARAQNNQTYLSLASHVPTGPVALDLAYFYLSSRSKVARTDSLGDALASKMNQTAHGVSVQISAPLMGGDVLPFGRVTYALLAVGPAVETGNGPMVLSVDHGHQTTGRFELGSRFGHTYSAGDDYYIRPTFTVAGEVNDRAVGETSPMSLESGSSFFAPAPTTERFSLLGRVGVEVTRKDLSFQIGASERKTRNQNQSLFNLGVAYRF